MKTKKFSKKLVVNKTTISNLNQEQLNDVKGGVYTQFPSCNPTCSVNRTSKLDCYCDSVQWCSCYQFCPV
jgi:hypothetical protein